MPKVTQYRAQSIIYFEGDKSEKIYILKSGHVVLSTTDIETGEPVRNTVQIGEFIGVESALGNFPRSEDAKILRDSDLVVMSVPEFERIAQANPRIMLKMLKVFSTQLRRIHAKVQSLLNKDDTQVDVSEGLFHCGEYYFAHEKYDFAKYAFKKYLHEFSDGARIEAVKKYQNQIASATGEAVESTEELTSEDTTITELFDDSGKSEGTQIETNFNSAKNQFATGNIKQAYQILRNTVNLEGASENPIWSEMLLYYGRCLYRMEKYKETVQTLSEFAKNNSTHLRIFEVLFYIGDAYRHLREKDRARLFLQRSVQFPGADEQFRHRVQEILEIL